VEAAALSGMLVPVYKSAQHHNPEDHNLHVLIMTLVLEKWNVGHHLARMQMLLQQCNAQIIRVNIILIQLSGTHNMADCSGYSD
jgi:hypothetical protein